MRGNKMTELKTQLDLGGILLAVPDTAWMTMGAKSNGLFSFSN